MSKETPFPPELLLPALYETSADAIVIADAERRIVGCNAAFEALLGYSQAELLGKSTKTIYANPDDFDSQGSRYFNTATPRRPGVKFIEYRRKDGGAFPSETVATQIRDADGEIIGFIGLIRDMTEYIDFILSLKRDNRTLLNEIDRLQQKFGDAPR